MTDPTYNEDVREFILDRYDALGNASAEMRALIEAKARGKFTTDYTTVARDAIAGHVNTHHADDANMPDLSTWTGDNTPQRVYIAQGGQGLTLAYTLTGNGGISTVTVIAGGSGWAVAPIITVVDENPFSTAAGAELAAVLTGDAVTSATIVAPGANYSVSTVLNVTPGTPATPASTDDQQADDAYIPDGWDDSEPNTNDSDARHVFRSERTGYEGMWSVWGAPTLTASYVEA